jgi:hypothetical protein
MGCQLTKQEITKEIIRSGKDPAYFIDNYTKISHPLHGLIPFKLYDYQEQLITDFNDYRFNVILKARQLGISTITAAYIAWMLLFHRDKNVLVMATKFSTAGNLVKKVKAIVKNLPPWIKIANVSVDNRTSFELTNGSQIKASSTSVDAGRSEALSLLVVDEAAHVENLDDLWTGLYPTLSTGGRCIALSTPNGVGNWFHKAYTEAEQDLNDFYATKLLWDVHPDRDEEWYEKETKNMSRRQIAQELKCNFNTSGETVIHPDDSAKIEKDLCSPKYRVGFDRNFWIWENYDPGHTYLLAADVARGDGQDNSVFHIVDLDSMEIAGEYQGKITPDIFSNLVFDAGKQYGNCMVIVENNTIGFAILDKLKELEYPNIYYSIKSTHEYIDQIVAENHNSSVAGFTTSLKTRPIIIAKMEEFVRNRLITIRSARLFNEFKTFIWDKGRPQAMRGYNDDLTMAFAIACWVKDTVYAEKERETRYKEAMLNSMVRSESTLNTTIPGMTGHRINNAPTPEKVEEIKKYMWLYKG